MAVVVVDASVVVAWLSATDAHHDAATAALAERRHDELVIPASGCAEVLVHPARAGAAVLSRTREALGALAVRIAPLTEPIAVRAAQLRAAHAGLRLPDALVLATGDALAADEILTADARWSGWSGRVVPLPAV